MRRRPKRSGPRPLYEILNSQRDTWGGVRRTAPLTCLRPFAETTSLAPNLDGGKLLGRDAYTEALLHESNGTEQSSQLYETIQVKVGGQGRNRTADASLFMAGDTQSYLLGNKRLKSVLDHKKWLPIATNCNHRLVSDCSQ